MPQIHFEFWLIFHNSEFTSHISYFFLRILHVYTVSLSFKKKKIINKMYKKDLRDVNLEFREKS